MPRTDRPFRRSRSHRLARIALLAPVVAALVIAVANAIVLQRTESRVVDDASALRPAQVAIVPGSHVRPDGTLGQVVAERVDSAVALYAEGLVDAVLVSGDHGTPGYNETDPMRRAVLEAGVPAEDVFADYAGFSTWHTLRRARQIFDVRSAVVVTQGTYAARTADLGVAAGIDTQAYVVREGGRRGREVLARVRGLVEATGRPGVTGGAEIPITGDGRASWAENAGEGGIGEP